ncbi:zeta toxin [Pontibacter amylolyticus]|uniref:zeta toxin n=1 Tax=Pontibacter amylolyticus TaxID=1424080 RepID=UPI00166AC699|nr:zeta toxin [Pontibacter amylolyticus]
MSSTNSKLRLRVFAGPNGSGKSTIINAVRAYKVSQIPVDFGIYINADDIAKALQEDRFSFDPYRIEVADEEFSQIAVSSGLIHELFDQSQFAACYRLTDNRIELVAPETNEQLAQIIADFLRKKLLLERKKFSFETVFSHPSKLDIMREAAAAGYKVYLYFVSTESPEINKFRVHVRTQQGGHDVPEDKIEQRYYRSLGLLFEAAQLAYQVYFFDNSRDGEGFQLFAHFKKNAKGEKDWDELNPDTVPNWFLEYYSNKVSESR